MPSFYFVALKLEDVSEVIYFCRQCSYVLETSNKVVHALIFSSMNNQNHAESECIVENSS